MPRAARLDQVRCFPDIKAECLLCAVHVRHRVYGNCPLAVMPSSFVNIRNATFKERRGRHAGAPAQWPTPWTTRMSRSTALPRTRSAAW